MRDNFRVDGRRRRSHVFTGAGQMRPRAAPNFIGVPTTVHYEERAGQEDRI